MDSQSTIGNQNEISKGIFKSANNEMQECIENCTLCHQVCEQTLAHCLEMGGKHAEATHIRALIDCAQTCTTSADFMLRQSDIHSAFCKACAEACSACAESCEQFKDDEKMMACADICRMCAESCEKMAARH